MCIGIFLCMLDTTIMNITLPAIQKGMSVDLNTLSWALNIYTISFAVFTIPLGRIAEILGRHRVYIIGLFIFLLGSVGCGFSKDVYQLIAFRAAQSIGAAIVFPTSMVIGISTTTIEKRQNVIAALGVTQGLAAALGPTIGGIVTQYLGWRWVFIINIPLIAIALFICLFSLKLKNEERTFAKIDVVGAILSMLFLFSLTLGLVKGREWSWFSAPIILLLASSLIFLLLFIKYEKQCKEPMIPINLFKNRQFIGASLTVVLSNLFLIGVTVLLPTFLTKIQGENELRAALLVTPISAMIFIFSPIAAILIKKLGSRVVIFSGFFAMTLAYVSLAYLDVSKSYTQMMISCLLLGFGYGIIVGPITVLAASDFTGELLTASQSVIGVLRQIGTVLAVAIFVSSLTANISSAKEQALRYSEIEINKLQIPNENKKIMQKQTEKQILSEIRDTASTQHISAGERDAIIEKNYQKTLGNLEGSELNKAAREQIKRKVVKQVDAKIKKINEAINKTIIKIKNYTQQNISDAFLILYKWSIPFIFISCFISAYFFRARTRE
nr:MDR family MFS transporter [Listeria kieliensis]